MGVWRVVDEKGVGFFEQKGLKGKRYFRFFFDSSWVAFSDVLDSRL